jgi:lipopolysaccharide transport system permease protein
MWTVPIIYLDDILPEPARRVIVFNPPYPFVRATHDLLVFSKAPPAWVWPAMAAWAILAIAAGCLVLRALRAEIRDVI